ncbi:hypothetical protein AGMMS49944_03270 [Spirochaetia bacterium]|nr:hypothetical protein AGMMS49944_03270 [Spirochaetia bacterium]
MPVTLPPPRWALTPPFHPYRELIQASPNKFLGGLFSVALSVGGALRPAARELPGIMPYGARTFLTAV